jgi:hypothetical protein
VRLFLITAYLMTSTLDLSARNCAPLVTTKNEGHDFIAAFIESLESVKLAIAAAKNQAEKTTDSRSDPASGVTDLMIGLKQSSEEYECAATLMRTYAKSRNKGIAESAGAIAGIYEMFIQQNKKMLTTLRETIDGKSGMGSLAESVSDFSVQKDEIFRFLIRGTSLVTWPVISEPKQPSETVQRLTITRTQQQAFLTSLERIHGPAIKQGFKAGLLLSLSPAYLLYDWLNKGWQFASEQ